MISKSKSILSEMVKQILEWIKQRDTFKDKYQSRITKNAKKQSEMRSNEFYKDSLWKNAHITLKQLY